MQTLKDRLVDILLNKKLITQGQLDEARALQKERGGRLSDIIASLGFVDKQDFMLILSQELGIPPINLSKYRIDPATAHLIPRKVARHYELIPVSKIGATLTVAMADPLNVLAIDDIKSLTGYQINIIISSPKEINEAIESIYGEEAHQAIEDLVKGIKKTQIEILKGEKEELLHPTGEELQRLAQDAPVIKVTDAILSDAATKKASDIMIEPMGDQLRLRYRIDGALRNIPGPPRSMHNAIVSRIKVMSMLNIAEHRLPQDGRFKVRIKGREVDFRVSIMPTMFGEKAVMRILDKAQAPLDIEKLGFHESALRDLKEAAMRPHGMILVCGPTGSGKTTTLYAILKFMDSPELNIITVEDPVEYQLEGINQVTAKPAIGLTFAAALRSILRQDPDIIMVGEIRDFDTVDIAIKAALTGHLVLSTVHTNTATAAVVRLVNMGVEPFLIASSVIAIAAQRLVRTLCPSCREPYSPSDALLEGTGVPLRKSVKFYRARGCGACLNTGYKGRVGLIEVLPLRPKIRELIENRAHERELREAARAGGMKTLRESGLEHVLAGRTSLEEVLRVTVGE